jgi:hypothetical protein
VLSMPRTPAAASTNKPLVATIILHGTTIVTWVDRARAWERPGCESAGQLPPHRAGPIAHLRPMVYVLPDRRTTGRPRRPKSVCLASARIGGRGAVALQPPDEEGDR